MAFTHFDDAGQARMVDVSAKEAACREAVAEGRVRMLPATLAMIRQGTAGKGDVLGVARVAAIMAAKDASRLIPLCHPLLLTGVEVSFFPDEETSSVGISATVRTAGRTGAEMEALTAVAAAALTVYDMCKAADRGMTVEFIRLAAKSGGKSGVYVRDKD